MASLAKRVLARAAPLVVPSPTVDLRIRQLVDAWLVPLMVDEFLKRKPPVKETVAPKERAE